jgi:hypothetical protein
VTTTEAPPPVDPRFGETAIRKTWEAEVGSMGAEVKGSHAPEDRIKQDTSNRARADGRERTNIVTFLRSG